MKEENINKKKIRAKKKPIGLKIDTNVNNNENQVM